MNIFITATTTEGKTELFNVNKVLSFVPDYDKGTVKILMGAGLYWTVYADSIEHIDCINDLLKEIKGDF